jgi:UDP-3-O-[3-hydroxymyristoyl] N-acetylglucosamine deacetylase
MDLQRTLKRSLSCAGIGLHSGKKVNLSLKPAPAGTGIRFRRTDLGGVEIPARVSHVGAVAYATQLKLGEARVETVEHLLAALASTRIDNAFIELNTPEVPIMDGSSAPFIYLVQEAGVRTLAEPRKYLKVTRPVTLTRGDKQIALFPSDHFKVSYTIGFDHPLLRHQTRTIVVTEDSFIEDIAPARTFTFLKEVEMLRQNGLALGGSLDNAIVISDTGVLNSSLRFEDEFVRHKILDLIGDFALLGHQVIAHAVVHRGGHALHTAMAAQLLQESDAWQLVEEPSAVPVAARTVPVTVTS